MKRILLILVIVIGFSIPSDRPVMGNEEVVIVVNDNDLSSETSTPIETVPYTEEPPSVDYLIPEVGNRELMDTKQYCDERVGISEAYANGGEPSEWMYRRFDWCQQSLNRQQGIGWR